MKFNNELEAQKWLIQSNSDYCLKIKENSFEFVENRNYENLVISIEEIENESDNFVYDIETEDGTFQAGLGSLIVKNTDSIYTKFVLPDQESLSEEEKIHRIYDISIECAKRISETFKAPIELEMEDLKYPIALYSKKRYVYRCLERNWKREIKDNGIVYKGLQMVRRDSCPYVKKVANPILHELMYNRDIEKAKNLAIESVKNLLEGKVNISDLVITKSLKASYKETNKAGNKLKQPAHWFLSKKIKARSPGNEPKPGSRVSFIFIENKDKTAQQSDRVEDPIYAEENKIKPDYLYYLDRQIASPLETIFSVLIKKENGELYTLDKNSKLTKEYKRECANQLWGKLKMEFENKSKGQTQINQFFKKKIKSLENFDSDEDEIISD